MAGSTLTDVWMIASQDPPWPEFCNEFFTSSGGASYWLKAVAALLVVAFMAYLMIAAYIWRGRAQAAQAKLAELGYHPTSC